MPEQPDPETLARRVLEQGYAEDATDVEIETIAHAYLAAKAELADLRLRCDIQRDELEVLRGPEGARVGNLSDSG